MVRRRPSVGRQKIEIKKIENEEARQVCFSKRRTGLFKKASELSILCGAELAVVVFSPAGKVFSFGHPSVDAVVDRFLAGPQQGAPPAPVPISSLLHSGYKDLNRLYTELSNKLEAERKKREAAEKALKGQQQHYWRDVDIEDCLGLQELEAFRVSVEELKCSVAGRAEKLLLDAAAAASRRPQPAPPSLQPSPTVNLSQFGAGGDPFHYLVKDKGTGLAFGSAVADASVLRRSFY